MSDKEKLEKLAEYLYAAIDETNKIKETAREIARKDILRKASIISYDLLDLLETITVILSAAQEEGNNTDHE